MPNEGARMRKFTSQHRFTHTRTHENFPNENNVLNLERRCPVPDVRL